MTRRAVPWMGTCPKERCRARRLFAPCEENVPVDRFQCRLLLYIEHYVSSRGYITWRNLRSSFSWLKEDVAKNLVEQLSKDEERWEADRGIWAGKPTLRLWRKHTPEWEWWVQAGRAGAYIDGGHVRRIITQLLVEPEPATVAWIAKTWEVSRLTAAKAYRELRDVHGWRETALPPNGRGRPTRQIMAP